MVKSWPGANPTIWSETNTNPTVGLRPYVNQMAWSHNQGHMYMHYACKEWNS